LQRNYRCHKLYQMKKPYLLLLSFLYASALFSQTPEVTSWIINVDGETGYDGILSNCMSVQYSDNWVYVNCTCIPAYDIGPWPGNPNIPADQDFLFKITRNPQENTGTPIATSLGHIGVWTNGVTIFNAKDAMSYQNEATWNQNAIIVEAPSFDNCLGHPQQQGEYHLHLNPTCLYDDTDASVHAPIIGYAFDGFPIYGAYGYANPDGSGGIARMESSYQLRSITARETLPDGTALSASLYGPSIGGMYPLGYYIEDFEYVDGLGHLDAHNGRWCVTPEYPSGTYAYFVTIDENQDAVYPYTLGLTYYGTVPAGNTGMGSGHNTISETVETYTYIGEQPAQRTFTLFPNPADEHVAILLDSAQPEKYDVTLTDFFGRTVLAQKNVLISGQYYIDLQGFSSGMYFLKLSSGDQQYLQRLELR